jgi:hypothetical protein
VNPNNQNNIELKEVEPKKIGKWMKMKIVVEVEKYPKFIHCPRFFTFPTIFIFIHYYHLLGKF